MPSTASDLVLLPSRRSLLRKANRARGASQAEQDAVRRVRRQAAVLESARDRELQDVAAVMREDAERFGRERTPTIRQQQHVAGAALVREAVRRTLGLRYHGVQLLAGLALADGHAVEMATGEGKTIVTAIPAFLAWLDGKQSHVATPNAYLAQRDAQQLQPVFELLGLSSALLPEHNDLAGKRAAYERDVVYGTGYEFGFDDLRDQLALRALPRPELGASVLDSLLGRQPPVVTLQTCRQQTIVDEIDSVLIDEAMTPLILSEGSGEAVNPTPYFAARDLAAELVRGEHFHLDLPNRAVRLTDRGRQFLFAAQNRPQLGELRRPWDTFVINALQARYVLQPSVDYVVRDDAVQIVDSKTGRIFRERSWRDGLHQAVEAHAGVTLTHEASSSARITRQRFFQKYESLCGMTGTAGGAETEFAEFYRLPTMWIPRHRPCRRVDLPDRFFASRDAKFRAIVGEVLERHRCGQPVLIGTRTIADSEILSSMLRSLKLSHELLNGLQDADEAVIVAQAGHYGAVTVATNMAGRGTDIQPDERALAVGGLFVLGVERHDSPRVDQQLAGRAGRQGDFGFSRFFVSGDDDLVQRFAPALAKRLRLSAGKDGEVHDGYGPVIQQFQQHAAAQAFQQRRRMVEHDRWLDDVLAGVLGEES